MPEYMLSNQQELSYIRVEDALKAEVLMKMRW